MKICSLSTGYARDLQIQMPPGSTLTHDLVKYKSHRGLACLHILLSNGLPILAVCLSPPACVILCQQRANSECYHGNQLSLRWIPSHRLVCNHSAFKSSQPEDLSFPLRRGVHSTPDEFLSQGDAGKQRGKEHGKVTVRIGYKTV